MSVRARPATLAALALLAALSGGCANDDSRPDVAATTAPPTSHLVGDGGALAAGSYQISFLVNEGVTAPDATIEVSGEFLDGDSEAEPADGRGWFVVSPDHDAFLGMWTVGRVQPDACKGYDSDLADPGPTVEDLANALVAQRATQASPPRAVTLGGYDGLYVELVGPDQLSTCPVPRLWGDPGGRWRYGDGQVDRLWILDVHGQRLVVDSSDYAGVSDEETAALASMVESLRFVETT